MALAPAAVDDGLGRILNPTLVFAFLTIVVLFLAYTEETWLPKTEHAKRAHHLLNTLYDPGFRSLIVLLLSAIVAAAGSRMAAPLELGGLNLVVLAAMISFALALFAREKAWIEAGQAVPIS